MSNSIVKSYVSTNNGQIHFRERAGRRPENETIVFLHQTASSSLMYQAMMESFPEGHRLVALDTPGFGGSFDPEGEPTMAEYGAMLSEALNGLGIDHCHLFGHHTGASIAVEMATVEPGRYATIAMIGPVVLTPEERGAFGDIYPKDFAIKQDGSHVKKMWDYVEELGADSVQLTHREFVDTARAWEGHLKVYRQIWDQDFGALFAKLTMPILIMCSPDDVLWGVFDRAKELRPDATAVTLGGSNFQPDQVPQDVVTALVDFIGS